MSNETSHSPFSWAISNETVFPRCPFLVVGVWCTRRALSVADDIDQRVSRSLQDGTYAQVVDGIVDAVPHLAARAAALSLDGL